MRRRPSGNVSRRRGSSLRPKQTCGGGGAQPGQRQVAGIQISGKSEDRRTDPVPLSFPPRSEERSSGPAGTWTRNKEQEWVLVLVLAQWLRPGGRAGWSLSCKTKLWSRRWAGALSQLGKSSCDPTRGTAAVEFQTGSLAPPWGTTSVNVLIRTSPGSPSRSRRNTVAIGNGFCQPGA